MKRTNFIVALGIVLLGVTGLNAQSVKSSFKTRTVELRKAVLTDTVNAKGVAYGATELLKTPVDVMFRNGEVSTLECEGYVSKHTFPKAEKGAVLHLVGFNAYANRYFPADMTITSANMFEVYVDGKLMATKATKQDSVSAASDYKFSHVFEPMHVYAVTIKILSEEGDKDDASLEVKVNNIEKAKGTELVFTAVDKRFYELTDNFIGTRPLSVEVSPCGEYVLTMYGARTDTKTINYYKVLTETKSGKTLDPRLAANVGWMPKTSKVYYSVKAVEGYDVYALDPETMAEEVLLAGIPEGNFIWSPAEDYLLLTVEEEAYKGTGPMRYHASQYDRVDGRGRVLLAKYDIERGLSERLTWGNRSSHLNDISADGKRLLFTTFTTDYSLRMAMRTALYEVDMETFEVDTIFEAEEYLNQAAYSPDGKEILMLAGPEAFDKIGMNCGEHKIANNYDVQAFILNRESGKVRPITKEFDPSISALIGWNKGNNRIYVKAEAGMCEYVYEYDIDANGWTKLNTEANLVRSFSMDNEGEMSAYTAIGMQQSSCAYVYNVKKAKSEQYANPMKGVYDVIEFGQEDDFVFKTEDGTSIEGFVVHPPKFDATKKYPMIVYYYGGTSPSQKFSELYYSAHLFASRGYMVYVVNPSGTVGYGQEFSARHVNAWGIVTAEDIITGVKKVCEKYAYVDKDAIGCIGASYGGFMTQYLLTRTDIFAGAVSHAGISNLASYWGEGFWGLGYSYVASADSYPWNNSKLYVEQGSLFNADKINTPILLLHGSVDTNVPKGESVQLYNALKRLGKEVEFVEIEGENHTIVKSLDKQILWHKTIMSFFERTLKGDREWWDAQYPQVQVE